MKIYQEFAWQVSTIKVGGRGSIGYEARQKVNYLLGTMPRALEDLLLDIDLNASNDHALVFVGSVKEDRDDGPSVWNDFRVKITVNLMGNLHYHVMYGELPSYLDLDDWLYVDFDWESAVGINENGQRVSYWEHMAAHD